MANRHAHMRGGRQECSKVYFVERWEGKGEGRVDLETPADDDKASSAPLDSTCLIELMSCACVVIYQLPSLQNNLHATSADSTKRMQLNVQHKEYDLSAVLHEGDEELNAR